MNTIFDKVNPKYLDCMSGTCGHTIHTFNGATLIVLSLVATFALYVAVKSRFN
jgi:hypothetical protein